MATRRRKAAPKAEPKPEPQVEAEVTVEAPAIQYVAMTNISGPAAGQAVRVGDEVTPGDYDGKRDDGRSWWEYLRACGSIVVKEG